MNGIPIKVEIDKKFLNELIKLVPKNQKKEEFLDELFNKATKWYLKKLKL